ncbi:MAG: SusC/RagA family TonB-linked outer membrane protein [Gemmatimonadota bacterium]
MLRLWVRSAVLAMFLALPSGSVLAQQPTTLTGRVSASTGEPLASASVLVEGLNLGSLTNNEGRFLIIIPAARVTGQTVQVTASLIGWTSQSHTVTLQPGTQSLDFTLNVDPLRLQELVVTGAGTQRARQKLATTINTVRAEDIERAQEVNIVTALAGKAPNVEVTSSAGDPGAGAYVRIRGANSLLGDGQPLIVVDGVPVDNSSYSIETNAAGTVEQNRAADINPADIESIQILKGASASAIYGSRAANGVVLITTKSGKAGTNNVQYRISASFDQVNKEVPLQTRFGQGLIDLPDVGGTTNDACIDVYGLPQDRCPTSWGAELGAGVPTFDHAGEIYQTGTRYDQYMSWSGGSETTQYFLSLGRTDHGGVIKGNSNYDRTTVRLVGSHQFRDDLKIGANFAYTDSRGDLIQQGSNISGIQLGALRTPPDFNNLPYLTEDGLHRSYRRPNPTSVTQGRGYDNPFWVANEIPNTSEVGRTFGDVNVTYTPFNWLTVKYALGADYSNDDRLTVFPKSSSDFPDGRIIRADLNSFQVDHNLVATAEHQFTDYLTTSLSVGQNLNHREFKRYQVNGQNLILGTDQLDFTVDRIPDEFFSKIRTDGYFAQGSVDLYDQIFVTGGVRLDGSSTFGGQDQRFFYPKASVAWDFTQYVSHRAPVSFGKLRVAYGVAGKQPDPYSNVSAYTTGTITDGWLSPNGLQTIYSGLEGVISQATLGNADIKPERTSEFEAGGDLALWSNRLALGLTYYRQNTTDAILPVSIPPSTGYTSKFANAGRFENWGWEATADLRVLDNSDFSWSVGAQWARNRSCVKDLAGSEQFGLAGFTGAVASVIRPDRDANGNITTCHPFGVFYGDDFIRFGRGSTVDGVDIDTAYPGWRTGDLFIGEDGFPQYDEQNRVIGDPNPDWTGSIRSSVTFRKNLTVSGLLDIKYGGDVWNGTKGALFFFGTHKDTEPYHGQGKSEVFGQTYYPNERVHGPGAGQSVNLDWNSWFWGGIGSGFTGPSSQFVEDGGFGKLREVQVSYTFNQGEVLDRLGLSSLTLAVAGRNLWTHTNYSGIDPESNLWGQTLGRGIDYFNNPQTRSWVVNLTVNR